MKIELRFGPMAAPLRTQLSTQGVKAPAYKARGWQLHADALTQLYVCGLLTDAETRRGRKRLADAIMKAEA